MTYGQIARLNGWTATAATGRLGMHATPVSSATSPGIASSTSQAGISTGRIIIQEPQLQRYLLEAEGVVFDAPPLRLSLYQWSAG